MVRKVRSSSLQAEITILTCPERHLSVLSIKPGYSLGPIFDLGPGSLQSRPSLQEPIVADAILNPSLKIFASNQGS
jgi:hypothetical protein